MVHLAVKEKLAIQQQAGETKLQLSRVEAENVELRKANLESDKIIEALRKGLEDRLPAENIE